MGFLLFFTLFLFFEKFKIKRVYFIGILIICIISVMINMFYTPWFVEYTQLEKDTLEIFEDVKTNFLVSESYSITSYGKAYYSYAPIYLNITTPSGWYKIPSVEYFSKLEGIRISIENKDCGLLIGNMRYLNNDYLIAYNKDCEFLNGCNLREINQINNVCLYKNG